MLAVYIERKDYASAERILDEMEYDTDVNWYWNYDSGMFWLYIHKGDRQKTEEKYFWMLEDVLLREVFCFGPHCLFSENPERLIKQNNKMIKIFELYAESFSKGRRHPNWKVLTFLRESNALTYYKLGERNKAANEIKELLSSEIYTQMIDGVEPHKTPHKNVIYGIARGPEGMWGVKYKEEDKEAYEFIENVYENL
jgi:hypothetical protein